MADKSIPSIKSWYQPTAPPNPENVTQSIFDQSIEAFKQRTKSTSKKSNRLHHLRPARLQDVVDQVSRAQELYDKNPQSKFHRGLIAFSKRVGYYGRVMDVMVQHHPEYVSLAWGTMKLMFTAVVEHERTGITVVTALTDIGDALSRIDLAETLYPTETMKATLVTLNYHIITFLLRALDWYESSTVSRAIQSITRPAALRYDDVLEDIRKTIGKVTDLAIAGSQAEQRDIHDELRKEGDEQEHFRNEVRSRLDQMQLELTTLVLNHQREGQFEAIKIEIQNLTSLVHSIENSQVLTRQTLLQELVSTRQKVGATQADIRHQLDEIQLMQALSMVSDRCIIDPEALYEYSLSLRRARRTLPSARSQPFWYSQSFRDWDQGATKAGTQSESCLELRGTIQDRSNIREFCVNVIEQLLQNKVAVLWVLHKKGETYNALEVLKSLVAQALVLDTLSHTDVVISSRIRSFEAAASLDEYAVLLANLLANFKLIYIIIDEAAISPEPNNKFSSVLRGLAEQVNQHNPHTLLKMMVIAHFSMARLDEGSKNERYSQLNVRRIQGSKRKGSRIPRAPLRALTVGGPRPIGARFDGTE